MAIPPAIASQVAALSSAINSAGNLDNAPFRVLDALAWQAGQTASAVEAAIPAAAGALDTWSAPLMPQDMVTGVLGLLSASQTQTALVELESFIARAEINLENR